MSCKQNQGSELWKRKKTIVQEQTKRVTDKVFREVIKRKIKTKAALTKSPNSEKVSCKLDAR